MKITEDTYFNYLDGLLSSEETQSFENYLSKNPESKAKMKQLQQSDNQLMSLLNDPMISKVPENFSKRLSIMQKKINQHESKQNKISKFFVNMFKPIFEIPAQAKILVVAMAIGIFFVGNNFQMQVAKNSNNEDILTAFLNNSSINEFLKSNNNIKSFVNIKLNNKSYHVKEIYKSVKTKSGNTYNIKDIYPFNSNTELDTIYSQPINVSNNVCPENNDQKDIQLSSENLTQFITLCSLKEKYKWKIVKMEIQQNEKAPVGISNFYKLFENN